ncbi:hypothetical protein [Nitrosomonas marina]|uniref:hypothetical protein n=1 Tax=Nitrosomonas marina TaxID=917 RepID=UPI0015A72AB2|nr:hypothetical protein [Nitrosomonas marina]
MDNKLNEHECGFENCACGYIHVLEAGADWPEEAWTVCTKCSCNVIDRKKVNSHLTPEGSDTADRCA